jgi:deoxyguanosine kinase
MILELIIVLFISIIANAIINLQLYILGALLLLIFEIYIQLQKIYEPVVISIDGNIGSGKSTLMKILKNNFKDYIFVDEPVNKWLAAKDDDNRNLLTNFYEDTNRWSYTFQNYAFITRTKNLMDAIEKIKPKTFMDYIEVFFNRIIYGKKLVIFTERCILTDRHVFAEMLHDSNNINSMEWTMYLDWYKVFKDSLSINNVVYLKTDPDKSFERVNKRARDEEKTVAIDYLQSVHDKHEKWLKNNSTTLVLDGNQEFEDDITKQLHIITQIKSKLLI